MHKTEQVFITGFGLIQGKIQKNKDKYIIDDIGYPLSMKKKDLHNVDRMSKISIYTLQVAVENRKKYNIDWSCQDASIMYGTEYGPLDSIHSFDLVSIKENALHVNPGQFPNTVINSPVCQMSIKQKIFGPAYTINNGITSTLDSIGLGYNFIRNKMVSKVIAGGGDEICSFQSMLHSPIKKAGEAFGFTILEQYEGDNSLREFGLCQILGYYCHSFATNSMADFLQTELYKAVVSLCHKTDTTYTIIKQLYCYSRFDETMELYLMNTLCQKLKIDTDIISLDGDWMGAGGIIQVVSHANKNEKNNDNVALIVNFDDRRISILLIKK